MIDRIEKEWNQPIREAQKKNDISVLSKASKPSLVNHYLMGELLREEFNELAYAIKQRNFVEVLDALADIRYLSDGWLAQMGVNQELFNKVLEEVHQSNLSKLVDGKVVFREDGKVLKPEGYFKPNIEKMLRVEE